MINVENKVNCTSCSACVNICPQNAIIMEEDKEGFKYPKIIEEKCIKCGMCSKVCPMIEKYKNKDKYYKTPKVMAAWTKEEEIRLDSTSGGVFTELAKEILENDGYVCGAIYDKDWTVKHIVTNKLEDLSEIRSSKYLQSNINLVFREIKEKLQDGKKVLVCGSPCQIQGLNKFLGKEYGNLITCDFICRGMNSPKIFLKYIHSLEKKYNSKVIKVKFKNKTFGWHNFATKIDFENGKKYIQNRYCDSYMIGYLNYNAFMRPSCYDCKFKGLTRTADITLADFWGIENIEPKLDNNQGTSLVMLNSKKGSDFFKKLNERIFFKEIFSDKIFRGNVCANDSVRKTEQREGVFKDIDDLTYEELSKKYFPTPNLKRRFRIYIREKLRNIKRSMKK